MRAPNRPRKPRKLATPTQHKDFGGEIPYVEKRSTDQDHVPTAVFTASDWPVDEEDYASVSSAPTPEEAVDGAGDEHKNVPVAAKPTLAERWSEVREKFADRFAREDVVDDGTIALSERRKERRAELRKIRWKKYATVGGVFAALGIFFWVLFFSPLFRYTFAADQITGVSTASIVNTNHVADVLKAHDGEQLLMMNRNELEQEVVRKVPEVAQADISLQLPRGLTVAITAQRPVACIDNGESCRGVAKDGTLLRLPAEDAESLTRIGELPEKMKPEKGVGIVLGILGVLDEQTLAQVTKVDFADSGLITLTLTDSRTVNWGTNSENKLKGEVLSVLVKEKVTSIDVSIPLSPVTQ